MKFSGLLFNLWAVLKVGAAAVSIKGTQQAPLKSEYLRVPYLIAQGSVK
jgi:hypothetical protein